MVLVALPIADACVVFMLSDHIEQDRSVEALELTEAMEASLSALQGTWFNMVRQSGRLCRIEELTVLLSCSRLTVLLSCRLDASINRPFSTHIVPI